MSAQRERSHSAAFTPSGRAQTSYLSWKAQRPQLFRNRSQTTAAPMASNTPVHMAVIADNQDHLVQLPNAIYDSSQALSLISLPKASATRGQINPCPATIITPTDPSVELDSNLPPHQPVTSSATITLRWRYEHGLQSFRETFYIIDAQSIGPRGYDAVLRGGVQVTPQEGAILQANPIYVGTPGKGGRNEREKREEEKRRKEREYRDQVERQREKVRAGLEGKGRR